MIRCHVVKVEEEEKTLRGGSILLRYTHVFYLLIYFSTFFSFYMTRFILLSFIELQYCSPLCFKLLYASISYFLPLTFFLSSYFCSLFLFHSSFILILFLHPIIYIDIFVHYISFSFLISHFYSYNTFVSFTYVFMSSFFFPFSSFVPPASCLWTLRSA